MWPFTNTQKENSWFVDKPKLMLLYGEKEGDRPVYELLESFIYDEGMIPKGTKTDLASIPGFFEWYAEPDDMKVIIPSIIHDRDYTTQKCTRLEADRRFRKNLIRMGMRKTKAYMLYYAVRIGGWKAWDRK